MRFIRIIALAGFLLLCCVRMELSGAESPNETRRLRIMTYNIHHAEGLDGKVDTERIAKLINDEKADLVALQEVDRGAERTKKRDLLAELAAATGMKMGFGKNIPLQGGEYGTAILSKFP